MLTELLLRVVLASASSEPASLPAEKAIEEKVEEPFAWGDFTWLNGANRQKSALLDTPYFTGSFILDVNYSYSFNHPIDHTIIGSTVTGRHNEISILMASFGGDFHYKNARGTLTLQLGQYSTIVPSHDPSVTRGQYDLQTAFRFIREAYAGYHWDAMHGINLDVGIFMSYIGLFSYINFENWAYQPSYVSDNTPFFFQGIRLQLFPTTKFKAEIWLVNGFQTYAKFNETPGLGYQFMYRPAEWISIVFNGYGGFDTPNTPWRVRLHSDNSLLIRYHNRPGALVNRAAFSLTLDIGCEHGSGVSCFGGTSPAQNFLGFMFYNRFWLLDDLFAFTFGGGAIHNPGRYLVLVPSGAPAATWDTSPGTQFDAWDFQATFDFMPSQFMTWRFEYTHRTASIPYYSGPGGVTSPDGYTTTPIPDGWKPDMRNSEDRLILALMFRM